MHPSILRRVAFLSTLSLAAPATAGAQSFAYLVSSSCGRATCTSTIRLVDATTGAQVRSVASLSGGFTGFETATSLKLSSDGRRLYLTAGARLAVFDAASGQTIGTVNIGGSAADVAVLPDGSRAYVAERTGGTVVTIDLPSLTVIATITVGASPRRIVASPDGSAVYVSDHDGGTISRISTASNTVSATIPVGTQPLGLDLSPDGSRLFVANSGSASVSVIDPAAGSVLRTLPAGGGSLAPSSVSAPSTGRVVTSLSEPAQAAAGRVDLLDASSGMVLGSAALPGTAFDRSTRFARDATGSVVYGIDAAAFVRVSQDGNTITRISSGGTDAAVLTDACAFVGRASPSVFGPGGGSGTLTVAPAAGCAWSFDAAAFPGVTFSQPTSGSGPATLTFTMGASSAPRYGSTRVGLGDVSIEQTIPAMNVDFASGQTLPQPVTIGGWAIDRNAVPLQTFYTGVDRLDVWAYPASGAAPVFLGNPALGIDRPDVAAAFGDTRYRFSGFNMIVSGLSPGDYTVVFYAHSARSNLFSSAQAVTITLLAAGPPLGVIENPPPSGHVQPRFTISGWAVDPAGSSVSRPSGVAVIDMHAYPDAGGPPIAIGSTSPFVQRQDVAAYLGPAYLISGYTSCAALAPGSYTLAVFAHRTGFTAYTPYTTRVTVDPATPTVVVDTPKPGSVVPQQFSVGGWALEQSTCSGSGVDVIHVWAYPVGGSTPVFVGSQTFFGLRFDVSAIFGFQYAQTGFGFNGTLAPGTYDLAVFARSTATKTFGTAKVVRITVQ